MSDVKAGISADQLKDILATVIAEARKPVITDKEIREEEQAREARRANAEASKQEAANKKFMQDTCSHLRRDGSCRAVFVKGSGPDVENFLICQFCQCIIRPSEKPELFNKLFQMAAGASDIIF